MHATGYRQATVPPSRARWILRTSRPPFDTSQQRRANSPRTVTLNTARLAGLYISIPHNGR